MSLVRASRSFFADATVYDASSCHRRASRRSTRNSTARYRSFPSVLSCVTRPKFEAYRASGVTRLSLGVQSLDDAILLTLGRLHGSTGARRAFEAARAAGCDNVSVDLMYGLPDQDGAAWRRTVGAVLDWRPDHLSPYGLSLDAGSVWGSTEVPGLPPEDTVVEQYWTLAREARARGYDHYEISNYARPGFSRGHSVDAAPGGGKKASGLRSH